MRRAYFHAPARRLVYVKLPPEEEQEGTCGKLLKALYGTRDAAQNWEHAYIDFMTEAGFTNGTASPCVFYHRERNIRAVVHGDDFTVLAQERQLDWFRERIAARFEVKFRGRLGPTETRTRTGRRRDKRGEHVAGESKQGQERTRHAPPGNGDKKQQTDGRENEQQV